MQAITWVGELPLAGGGKQLISRGKQEARGKHVSNGSWKIKAEDSKDKTAGWQNSLRDKSMLGKNTYYFSNCDYHLLGDSVCALLIRNRDMELKRK